MNVRPKSYLPLHLSVGVQVQSAFYLVENDILLLGASQGFLIHSLFSPFLAKFLSSKLSLEDSKPEFFHHRYQKSHRKKRPESRVGFSFLLFEK